MTSSATPRRLAAAAVSVGLVALGPAATAAAPSSIGVVVEQASGTPGYCTDDVGVTVVVDFTEIGGDVVVRCATGAGGHGFTGLDALAGAGFSVAGTQRWGMQFVCRIQGRPTAHEDLAIPGDDGYHESCDNTPPDTAYWGYWYASNGGSWRYSTVAAASHDTISGGFEGWSFHLGSASAAPPGVAPSHPVETPTTPPPTAPTHHGGSHSTGAPTTGAPTSSAPTGTATTSTPTGSGHPRHQPHGHRGHGHAGPTQTVAPSTDTDPTTNTASGPQISTALPDEPDDGGGGSSTPLLVGVGVLALLGIGAGTTAWRRSHRG